MALSIPTITLNDGRAMPLLGLGVYKATAPGEVEGAIATALDLGYRLIDTASAYKNEVYMLPKHLDEKVAALHLSKLGVELEILSSEQAAYIGVEVQGPFKPEYYRY